MTRLRTTPCTLICGRTTLSPPDVPDAAERFAASPLLPRDEAGPCLRNHGRRRRLR